MTLERFMSTQRYGSMQKASPRQVGRPSRCRKNRGPPGPQLSKEFCPKLSEPRIIPNSRRVEFCSSPAKGFQRSHEKKLRWPCSANLVPKKPTWYQKAEVNGEKNHPQELESQNPLKKTDVSPVKPLECYGFTFLTPANYLWSTWLANWHELRVQSQSQVDIQPELLGLYPSWILGWTPQNEMVICINHQNCTPSSGCISYDRPMNSHRNPLVHPHWITISEVSLHTVY